jgi:hypothetical protein
MRLTRRSLIVVSSIVLAAAFIAVTQAEAQGNNRLPQVVPAVDPAAPASWTSQCTPTEVAVYESRIHVRCAQGIQDGSATIYFWAVPATKSQLANRFLSIGSTALVAGRHLIFMYTPGDSSGAAFGCLATDCRNVSAIVLQ